MKSLLWKTLQAIALVLLVTTGALIAQALAPLVLPFLNLTLSGDRPRVFWYLGRSSAFVAYGWLWLSMALGLLVTNKLARLWPGGATAVSLHQTCGLLSLGFATFHAFILMGSRFLSYDVLAVLIPFYSNAYRPASVALGQIGLYMLVVLVSSFYVRRKITQRAWRVIHYASFGVFVLVTLHGLLTGTETTSRWAPLVYLSSGVSIVFLVMYRVAYAIAARQVAPKVPKAMQPKPAQPAVTRTASASETPKVAVVFGSQSGNAEGLAKRTVAALTKMGTSAQLIDGARFDVAQLQGTPRLVLITSTFGDGEPPDNITTFHQQLHATNTPQLEQLEFCVLALGDSSFANFAKAGRDFDARLAALGARRMCALVTCDTDYEQPFQAWLSAVQTQFNDGAKRSTGTTTEVEARSPQVDSTSLTRAAPTSKSGGVHPRRNMEETKYFVMPKPSKGDRYANTKFFPAPLLRNVNLTADSDPLTVKQIRHIVFSLLGSGIEYEPGDALGVLPENNAETVAHILRITRLSGSALVPVPDGGEAPLAEALTRHYDIVRLTDEHIRAVAERTGGAVLRHWLKPENAATLKKMTEGRELADLLNTHRGAFGDTRDFVSVLQKLRPRLYSISSSQKVYPSQVHLTVGTLHYSAHGKQRFGVCSGDLARATTQMQRNVFLHKQKNFRLPADPNTPIVMVGPGTGIAPFRAFLQERASTGATGKNWLFFGCCNARSDFLYQDELHQMQTSGVLTRLDVAFSRDQQQKVYVQHLMQEKAAKLWRWFDEGAHFYVCGDAARMAKDVDAALHKVAMSAGGLSEAGAQAWVAELKQQKRYLRDVY